MEESTKTGLVTYIVDSFTNVSFKGNPAGVCLCASSLEESLMQSIAKEMNLSETAFLVPLDATNHYSIRYFSPETEIPLCGHATLASAKVLFERAKETGGVNLVQFKTIEGIDVPVRLAGEMMEITFPAYKLTDASAPPPLLKALGVGEPIYSGHNAETNILMVEIANAKQLAELRPDFHALKSSHDAISGVLVTAKADDGFDFYSRYFWPWTGTNEDPVTGGTHTFLTPYWSEKLGKKTLRSFQASERTGSMEVELIGDDQVLIRGNAVIFLRGEVELY